MFLKIMAREHWS